MPNKLDRYIGEEQHGYWWINYDGALMFSKTLHGVPPEDYFKYAPWAQWWYVDCELAWYRMRKEIRNLDRFVEPIIA